MSMTRQLAWEQCSRVGAIAEIGTTKRTNVLVLGDINPAVLRPGADLTAKARKAFELQGKGEDIEVMTEDDFLRTGVCASSIATLIRTLGDVPTEERHFGHGDWSGCRGAGRGHCLIFRSCR